MNNTKPSESSGAAKNSKVGADYFNFMFAPPFPMVEEFWRALEFRYYESDDGVLILRGSLNEEETGRFELLTFKMPPPIKDGEHDVSRDEAGVNATFALPSLIKADSGKLNIKRFKDGDKDTIQAQFYLAFEYDSVVYDVAGLALVHATAAS
ncbi:MAG: hypothetical protein A2W79_08980 [Pseudomonadales bacterium RIFCSPLOWO2_12_60_38]|jgi:hypothetical protein|uniref:Uncharacterized protein n=1 Tax=Pseudomonas paracarnis TaxID=2750625 RepID=A0ABU6C151_9PSED|nr:MULTISPECIES: hypothetical protein [Pseudomonas]AOS73826.1 hypothetical protein BH711_07750 [Pseudomonas fluorescens]ETK42662.1 hypothetical protein H098_06125 [Pseudomonas fluorescens FH5]MDN5428120.1 hypothetical protein [Pseudomonadales bacterium]NLT87587.1 hypothetical protein [Pseudomonas lactis]OHC33631.1 MAG: hypothetical protein A2W79_08980 [Pseudomonadales bacterium RIFCSPLOWO2_12_60_38]OHC39770.1 MAG: hypothetical protein A3G72_23210 [Pseudomonadales bacterium RIFCSPLOWO2_12_FULL